MRSPLKFLVPFALRVELLRLRRLPLYVIERRTVARTKSPATAHDFIPCVLGEGESPLRREGTAADPRLQAGKEHNVALAASRLDGILIPPATVFSYHHVVGWPSRLRGFRRGLELHQGRVSSGVGGGCCQVANLLYLVALRSGMKITERHRHALDLYPDHDRRVPFGCGATVFYNYADLRFENPLGQPVLLRIRVLDGVLCAQLRTHDPVPWHVEIYETDHRFYRNGDDWYRENRIRRRFVDDSGRVLLDREEAHNVGRVLYDPRGHACCEQS